MNKKNKLNSGGSGGFTIVELVLTLGVASIFVIVFYQLFLVIERQASIAQNRSEASSIAYSTLRMYTEDERPTWFVCDSSTDLAANPSAPGQVVTSSSVTTSELPAPVTLSVIAFAPHGCADYMPVKLISTVEYGPSPARKVVHATYVGN